ncbi:phosphoglycerate mutase family protein [Patescibacteria group bacterium]|nr:phosphoglycerate mutase family protein [Patescibacteria group bacterium]
MKIFFIRHGEAMDDINDEYGGWHDPDLSPKGWVQAVELGLKLKSKGLKPDIILTSPLKRAVQTAQAIGEVLSTEVEVFQYIKERNTYGLLCGLNKTEAKENYPELVEAYEQDEEVLGYESYEFVLKRIKIALEKIQQRTEQTIICASHSKFLKAMLEEIFNKSIKDMSKSAIIEILVKDSKLEIVSMEGVEE